MAILIGVPAAVGFALVAVAVKAITTTASGSAYFSFRKRERFTFGFSFVSVGTMPGRLDVEGGFELVAGGGRRGRTSLEQCDCALPQPEQPVGREQHDGEEDQPDQRVERPELEAGDREVGL